MQLNFYYKHKIFSFICFDFMHRFFLLSVQCLMFFYCHSKTSVPKTKSHSRQKYKKRIPSAIFDQKSLDLNGWKSHSQVKDRVQIKISTNSQTVNWIWIKRFELTQQWTSNRIKRKILVPRKPTVWVRIQIVCCFRFEIVIVKLWRSEPDHEKKTSYFVYLQWVTWKPWKMKPVAHSREFWNCKVTIKIYSVIFERPWKRSQKRRNNCAIFIDV